MSLLRRGVLTPELAREADARRTRDGLRLGHVLLQMGVLTPEALNRADRPTRSARFSGAPSTGTRARSSSRSASAPPRPSSGWTCPSRKSSWRASAASADVSRLIQRLGNAQTILAEAARARCSTSSRRRRGRSSRRSTAARRCSRSARRGRGTAPENARLLYAFFCLGSAVRATAARRDPTEAEPGKKDPRTRLEGEQSQSRMTALCLSTNTSARSANARRK